MVKCAAGEKVPFSIGDFKDAAGNPASVDPAQPVRRLELINAGVGTLVDLAADQLSGSVAYTTVGTTHLEADIDADTTEGVKTFTLRSEDIEMVAGEAVTGGITLGTPVPA